MGQELSTTINSSLTVILHSHKYIDHVRILFMVFMASRVNGGLVSHKYIDHVRIMIMIFMAYRVNRGLVGHHRCIM